MQVQEVVYSYTYKQTFRFTGLKCDKTKSSIKMDGYICLNLMLEKYNTLFTEYENSLVAEIDLVF